MESMTISETVVQPTGLGSAHELSSSIRGFWFSKLTSGRVIFFIQNVYLHPKLSIYGEIWTRADLIFQKVQSTVLVQPTSG